MSLLTVKHLNKSYPTFSLNDVSFTLEAGRIIGFVGRNGAGKTTTIKSLLNFIHPDSGEIIYFGNSLYDHEAEVKGRIGYSGNMSWYPRKKLKEIVQITKQFYKNYDEEAYQKYLKMFHLDENKTPLELSDGMKVKFNLLLALSHHAEILILDEPTSGLDPFSRDELLKVLKALRQEGVAILFSTHIISDVEKCADDLLYISKGKIIVNLPLNAFYKDYVRDQETLEETLLRLEERL